MSADLPGDKERDGITPHVQSETPNSDFKALYHELLYAVGMKHPGETRHQTALRYIQQAERSDGTTAQEAKQCL